MENSLVELLKLARSLNEQNPQYYAEISYCANKNESFDIVIRNSQTHSRIRKCQTYLSNNPLVNWDNIIDLFKMCIRGLTNEQ